MNDQEYLTLADEIQRLRDEQQRLRDEQEKLRREKPAPSNGNNGNKNTAPGNDGQGKSEAPGEEKNQDGKGKGEGQGEEKSKEGTEEEKDQPKAPLKQRAQAFAREHPKGILFGAIGLVVLVIATIFLMIYLDSYETTDDAEVDGHMNAVSSRINGTVIKVYVEDNQMVSAGQLLAELDPRDFQTMLDQAGANVSAATANLAAENPNVPITQTANQTTITSGNTDVQSAQSGVVAAEKQYQARVAQLREAEANDVKAQTDVLRYRPLAEKDEVSKEQFDTILAQAKSQTATVQAAQASAEAAQKAVEQARDTLQQAFTKLQEANINGPRNVAIRKAGVQAREAALQQAQAQLEQAQLNMSYTKIYAPVAGIVGQKNLEMGQRLEVGTQVLTITQLDDIWITANFKETQLKKMHPNEAVDISVDAFGKKYHGYVESMPGATGSISSLLPPENATGNYVKVVQRLPVRIRLKQGEDPDHTLRPGMSVEPKVWLK